MNLVWLFALMPQHLVGPVLDIGVWMERRVVDGSSGPRQIRAEPWPLSGQVGE